MAVHCGGVGIGKYMVIAGLILLLGGCSGQVTGGNAKGACKGSYCPPETKTAKVKSANLVDLSENLSDDELGARLMAGLAGSDPSKDIEIAVERR